MIRSPIIVCVGHIDHGKCVSPNTMIPLGDGRILTAEEMFKEYCDHKKFKKVKDGVISKPKNKLEVFSYENGKIIKKRVSQLWKLKSPSLMVKIKLASGDEIETTPEHPFFVFKDFDIIQKEAKDINIGDYIAVPRILSFDSDLREVKKNIIEKLKEASNFVIRLDSKKSKEFIEKLKKINLQNLKKRKLFSTDPYTCLINNRFRARDFICLSNFLGFDSVETYEMINYIKNSSQKWKAGHTSNWMRLPKTREEFKKLGYILGCLAGDGYLNEGKLNKNEKDIVTDGGKTFSRFLIDVCGFPRVEKSEKIQLPTIFQSYLPLISSFIEGWLDTDGYVSHLNNSIEITSKSEKIIKQVSTWLLAFGIHSKIFKKGNYNVIRIANKPYLNLFLKFFTPKSKRKLERIQNAALKSSTSRIFDIIPVKGDILKKLKEKPPHFSLYKNYKRLSRLYLESITRKKCDDDAFLIKIEKLIGKEISFVKVVKKKIVKSRFEFVYDFTVSKTHNFVAERMIVHNTTLLDCIRGTAVTRLEPGMITQHAGASYVPIETIQRICGDLLQSLKIKIVVPGLLFLDTPGHAAFITLRRRGGAVSDLAILVVDITEGFQEQTDESLKVLKEFKTPFVVAATKIDKIQGWNSIKNACFSDSLSKQSEIVKDDLEKKVYTLIAQLSERGFNSERFDRVEDFRKQVAIVPCSGITGEGIPELLVVLAGLAQHFLKERLELSDKAKGVVLEVKETVGFGITIDVILYDGKVRKGDFLVVGGKEPVTAKIRALLRPKPLRELRVEKQFESVEEVSAAAGIKIAAPGLENVIAGSPIRFVSSEDEIEKSKAEVQKEIEEVEFLKQVEGVVVKADTLGSLEAMIKILTEENIPIRKAEVGHVSKQDVLEAQNVSDEFRKVILAFNVKILEEAKTLAKDLRIEIFQNNIIYRLIEEYKEWFEKKKETIRKEKMERLVWPAKIKILPGYVFRVSKPAIFGVEVLVGRIKPKVLLINKEGKEIGEIKEIQREMQTIPEAKAGDKVAISMEEPTVGRQIHEGEVLYVKVPEVHLKEILTEFKNELTEAEIKVIEELKEILF